MIIDLGTKQKQSRADNIGNFKQIESLKDYNLMGTKKPDSTMAQVLSGKI